MMQRLSLAALLVLALAACSSGGLGDLGGTLGDILGSSGSSDSSDVRGTVVSIDTGARAINLDVAYVNNLRDDRRGSTIYYDSETVVEYQNNTYRVDDLERGDEVSVVGSNESGRYVADRITVTRNVRQ